MGFFLIHVVGGVVFGQVQDVNRLPVVAYKGPHHGFVVEGEAAGDLNLREDVDTLLLPIYILMEQ